MTEVYVASLWLTCASADDGVLDEFAKRFNRKDQRAMEVLVYAAPPIVGPDPDPGPWHELNKMLTKHCLAKAIAAGELSGGTTELRAFENPGAWIPGKGGTHEGTGPLNGYGPAGGQPWFVTHQTKQGEVHAKCWWKRVPAP